MNPELKPGSTSQVARHRAVRRLQATHIDEWNALHAEERVRFGLPPDITPAGLADENRRLRVHIEELERKLAELNGQP